MKRPIPSLLSVAGTTTATTLFIISAFFCFFCFFSSHQPIVEAQASPEDQYMNLLDLNTHLQPPVWDNGVIAIPGCQAPDNIVHRHVDFDTLLWNSQYTDEQIVNWFAGNFTYEFPNFDSTCLLNYWNGIKQTTTHADCYGGSGSMSSMSSGSFPSSMSGSSGSSMGSFSSDLPSDGSGGSNTQDPMSELMSSLLSSVIESVIESSLHPDGSGSSSAHGSSDMPSDFSFSNSGSSNDHSFSFNSDSFHSNSFNSDSFHQSNSDSSFNPFEESSQAGDNSNMDSFSFDGREAKVQEAAPPLQAPAPENIKNENEEDDVGGDLPIGAANRKGEILAADAAGADDVPVCVPFGIYAKCIMYTKELLRLSILRSTKNRAPYCWCPSITRSSTSSSGGYVCATAMTTATPQQQQTTTGAPQQMTTTMMPTTTQGGIAPPPTTTANAPVTTSNVVGTTTAQPQQQTTTTSGSPQQMTTTAAPLMTTTATNGGIVPPPISTTQQQQTTTAAPQQQTTTRAPVVITTTNAATAGPGPSSTTQQQQQQTTSGAPAGSTTAGPSTTTVTTTTTTAPPTPAPTRPPTSVEATLANPSNFQEQTAKNQIAEALSIDSTTIKISKLNETTIEIGFSGPNAAQNVVDFLKLNSTVLTSMDISGAQAAPGEAITTAPPPETSDGKSNVAMIAVVIIVVAVVLGGGYFAYTKRDKIFKGSGSSSNERGGVAQAFNLDYDEDVMLGGGGYEFDNGGGNGALTGDEMMKL